MHFLLFSPFFPNTVDPKKHFFPPFFFFFFPFRLKKTRVIQKYISWAGNSLSPYSAGAGKLIQLFSVKNLPLQKEAEVIPVKRKK